MLSGQPRFADVLTPFMAFATPMEARWDDSESTWRQYENGTYELVEERNRLKGRGGWTGLSWSDLKQLHGILRAGVIDVTPRTRAAGDPAVAELLIPCRRTSPLNESAPLYEVDAATGQRLYRLEIEFESVVTYDSVPGALYGGLVLVEEDADFVTVDRWGVDTSWDDGALTVEFDGDNYDLGTAELLPEEIAALVLLDDPADPDSMILDAINDFQAPPPTTDMRRALLRSEALQALLTAIRAARDATFGARDTATTAAGTATTAAATATTKAGEASTSADTATTAAAAATTKAGEANTSAGAAATSAGAANTSAGAAATSAGAASTSAGQAGTARDRAVLGATAALALLETGGDVMMPLVAGGEILVEDVVPMRTLHAEVGALSESARLSSERARRTADRVASALGGAGEARVRLGSTTDVWQSITRLSEDVTGAVSTLDEGEGPVVLVEGSGAVAWEIDLGGVAPAGVMATATAASFVVVVGAAPELVGVSMTAEILDTDGSTIRIADGVTAAVPGHGAQVVALEGVALTAVSGAPTRGQRLRLTLDISGPGVPPAQPYLITIGMAAAPFLRVPPAATDATRLQNLAPFGLRGTGPLPVPAVGRQQFAINMAGTVTLPAGVAERTQMVVWHDAASGNVEILAPAGTTLRGSGVMTARGQRRECVLYNNVWYVG